LGIRSINASQTVPVAVFSKDAVPEITVTKIPEIPLVLPIFPEIPKEQTESYWNQLEEAPKNLGLKKFDIELIANQAQSNGINLSRVNEICSSSLYDFNVKRTRKRKISEIEDEVNSINIP